MATSILVIRGNREDLVAIRRLINGDLDTANIIFHEGQLNPHVPDLPDGYAKFHSLFMMAIDGPRLRLRKQALKEEFE